MAALENELCVPSQMDFSEGKHSATVYKEMSQWICDNFGHHWVCELEELSVFA